ncbi:MAG: hypothetical protein KF862_00900 [Chitinophagaceae bacterium]|nr:hypothetical protein [Chitinophagaceae bacterium]
MVLLSVQLFLGRFHPLIVHLPVGFLLLAVILQLTGCIPRYRSIRSAVPLSLLTGCASAIMACITGYLLSLDGDYNPETLSVHMWLGIFTAIVSFIAWLISIHTISFKAMHLKSLNVFALAMLVLITAAGHYGGTLTHGSGYISTDIVFEKPKEKKQITNAEEALVFEDIVYPILQNKCGNCHNNNKKKGRLSMETLASLKKGGKHGAVITEGKPLESELIKRVLLDPADEKFMPTDGKPPLTGEETAIIQWWIESQMSGEDKKLALASPPSNIKEYILHYLGAGTAASSSTTENAATSISAPPVTDDVLAQLNNEGFVIKQISYDPDLLDITLPSTEGISNADKIKLLEPVKSNILWLNVSGNKVTDDQLAIINTFSNLQRLRLDKTPVTDAGIRRLADLSSLESINLCYTKITEACLADLSNMKSLQSVYTWGTPVKETKPGGEKSHLKIVSGESSNIAIKP